MANVTNIKVITRKYLVDQFRNYNKIIVQPGLKHLDDVKADKKDVEDLEDNILRVNKILDELNSTLSGKDGIRDLIDEAIKGIIAGAPESFDTLREIADWIENDKTGAAAMANKISEHSEKISELKAGLAKIRPETVDIDFDTILNYLYGE